MLKQRVITALWGIPLLIAAIWFDQPLPWFTLLIAIWGLLAVFEFYKLAKTANSLTLTYFGLIWTLLFIVSPHFNYNFATPLLLTSSIVLSLIWLLRYSTKGTAFINWAWTIAGILYIGWLSSHLVALRGLDTGRDWVFLALFATFGSDSAAFFIGRWVGKYHLAQHISPGKTWEGAVAGVFGSIIVSLILINILSLPLGYGGAILLGVLISVFGQLGDLVESLFKRNIGVKDSGKLIPGHGGFLDRIDSILFAGVVVYYYAVFA
jgi:phosphatidate cytidylyltransferase